jgi:hypothetical protein
MIGTKAGNTAAFPAGPTKVKIGVDVPVPPGVVTAILTSPSACSGVTQVIEVSLTTTTLVAG